MGYSTASVESNSISISLVSTSLSNMVRKCWRITVDKIGYVWLMCYSRSTHFSVRSTCTLRKLSYCWANRSCTTKDSSSSTPSNNNSNTGWFRPRAGAKRISGSSSTAKYSYPMIRCSTGRAWGAGAPCSKTSSSGGGTKSAITWMCASQPWLCGCLDNRTRSWGNSASWLWIWSINLGSFRTCSSSIWSGRSYPRRSKYDHLLIIFVDINIKHYQRTPINLFEYSSTSS